MVVNSFDEKELFLPRGLRKEYQNRIDEACRQDPGDGSSVAKVLGDIAREVGVIRITRLAGLERTSFYRTFNGKTDPRISTIAKLIRALGVKVILH